MRITCLSRLVLTCLFAGAISSAGAQTQVGGRFQMTATTLEPGDIVKIAVWRQPEYSCDCMIAADGTITHPLYRAINVTGLPISAVEDRIRSFLGQYMENPAFVMSPLLRVVVGGEVRQPNIYTVPPGTSVAQAVALAGGATERGRLDQVRVLRNTSSLTVDLTKPDSAILAARIRSGDQILIPRRRNVMQDIVMPSSSIVAALGALTSVAIQLARRP